LVTTGRTPSFGQRLCRIVVARRTTGEPVGLRRGAARGLLVVVGQVLGGFAMWSALWHPRRRSWPDRVSGTSVVVMLGRGFGPVVPMLAALIVAAAGGLIVGLQA
jgi:hypothetical protein